MQITMKISNTHALLLSYDDTYTFNIQGYCIYIQTYVAPHLVKGKQVSSKSIKTMEA